MNPFSALPSRAVSLVRAVRVDNKYFLGMGVGTAALIAWLSTPDIVLAFNQPTRANIVFAGIKTGLALLCLAGGVKGGMYIHKIAYREEMARRNPAPPTALSC